MTDLSAAPIELLSGVKACKDCAFFERQGILEHCTRKLQPDQINGGMVAPLCLAERMLDVKDRCGPKAMHFLPSEASLAKTSVRRIQLQEAIEDGIERLNPDAYTAGSILSSLKRALAERYGDKAFDALQLADEFGLALVEIE